MQRGRSAVSGYNIIVVGSGSRFECCGLYCGDAGARGLRSCFERSACAVRRIFLDDELFPALSQ